MTREVPDEIIGKKFGRLIVISETRSPDRRGRFYICLCDCGNRTSVYAGHLKNGGTKSCGCTRNGINATHGMSRTAEYRAWENARSRCRNPKNMKFPIYGGRGIQFCERWAKSFENFLNDMGRKPSKHHSLDRKDSDGNYEPGNCRWATTAQQNNNRPNYNRTVEVNGIRMTVAEAARLTGIPHGTICSRIDRGWPNEDVLRNG